MNPLLLGWFDNLDWHFWKGVLLDFGIVSLASFYIYGCIASETSVDEQDVNGHTYIKIGHSKNFIHAEHCHCRRSNVSDRAATEGTHDK